MREVDNWHIKADGRVYQNGHSGSDEHSSRVVHVDGAVVTTVSGSKYRLGQLDPAVRQVLTLTRAAFDEAQPLRELQPLLYA